MKLHQKVMITGIIISVILLHIGSHIPAYMEKVVSGAFVPFFEDIANLIDEAERERKQNIIDGEEELRIGRDTCYQWENKYEIIRMGLDNEKVLAVYGTSYGHVLEKIKSYFTTKNALYVISKEGYAVVGKDKKCRVFITLPKEAFENGYTLDNNGNRVFNTSPVENDLVTYLNSFDEFEDYEKELFKEEEKELNKTGE